MSKHKESVAIEFLVKIVKMIFLMSSVPSLGDVDWEMKCSCGFAKFNGSIDC